MSHTEKMKSAAPVVLRIGLSLVFIWFSFQQLTNTAAWVRFIPDWVTGMSGLTAETLVHFNGLFELVFGICLLLGLFTRVVSLLLALHMCHITLTLIMGSGIGATSVRDFGLSIASIALFLLGPHSVSLDAWLLKRKENSLN